MCNRKQDRRGTAGSAGPPSLSAQYCPSQCRPRICRSLPQSSRLLASFIGHLHLYDGHPPSHDVCLVGLSCLCPIVAPYSTPSSRPVSLTPCRLVSSSALNLLVGRLICRCRHPQGRGRYELARDDITLKLEGGSALPNGFSPPLGVHYPARTTMDRFPAGTSHLITTSSDGSK